MHLAQIKTNKHH